MSASGLSAMLWFRADPARDAEVAAALQRVVRALGSGIPVRVGRRHEEDRPHRTWMIDAGPVDADRYEAMLWRLHKAVSSAGVRALAYAQPNLEQFEWLYEGEPEGQCCAGPPPAPSKG